MLKSKGLQVVTPEGILTANYNKDRQYPGIEIRLSGELVSLVEHYPEEGIRTILWKDNEDEYFTIINHQKFRSEK